MGFSRDGVLGEGIQIPGRDASTSWVGGEGLKG